MPLRSCTRCPHRDHPTEDCIECARREQAADAANRNFDPIDRREGIVSLDELREAGYEYTPTTDKSPAELVADAEEEIDRREGEAEAGAAGLLSEGAAGMLMDFLMRFLSLMPREMFVIGARFRSLHTPDGSPTITEIARSLGTSKQEVKEIMCNAVAKVPQLETLFRGVSLNLRPAQKRVRANGGSDPARVRTDQRRDLYRQGFLSPALAPEKPRQRRKPKPGRAGGSGMLPGF